MPPQSTRRHQKLLLAFFTVLFAVLVGAACGGSGGSVSADPTREGLRETVRAHAEAIIEKPADAYGYFSDACKDSLSRSDFAGQMILASAMFEGFFGFPLNEMKVSDVEVVDFEGATGSVLVTAIGPDGEDIGDDDEPEQWRYEDGRWVRDDCDDGFGVDSDDADKADDTEPAMPPVKLGSRAEFGDWVVVVRSVDQSDEVESYEDCTGCVGFAVNIEATYMGEDEGNAGWDLSLKYIGVDRTVYRDSGCYFPFPSDIEELKDQNAVVDGGKQVGNLCLSVPQDALGTGMISIEEYGFDGREVSYLAPALS
jgi:hypothetical protein